MIDRLEGYETREEEVEIGATRLRLLTVARLESLVDAGALLRDEEVPEPPYWAHLWTGSRVLAELVDSELECRGKRVIDVGCGIGLAGLAAAARGARVLLVDHVFPALRFAQASSRRNQLPVDIAVIDLFHPALRDTFDLCLAADVSYDPTLQVALADFFQNHLDADGEAWCVESVRTTDRGLAIACGRRGLEVVEREVSAFDEGRRIAVRVMIVRRVAKQS